MTPIAPRPVRAFTLLLLLGACAMEPPPEAPRDACEAGEPAIEAALYFGRSKGGGGEVTEAEWAAFLDSEVTPRFPDGLTVLDAYGQWRADAASAITKEPSKLLVIVLFDLAAARPGLEAVIEAYKARFRQQSVLLVTQPVCAAF